MRLDAGHIPPGPEYVSEQQQASRKQMLRMPILVRKLLRKGFVLSALLSAAVWTGAAIAQIYPERTITLIVPFAAGGSSDVTARIMAETMAVHLGQSIIIENVGGAGGSTGTARLKNAKPDGYTIGLGHIGTLASAVAVNPKLPYDPRTDFTHLGLINSSPNLIIVRKDFPANTLQEFVDFAKKNGKGLKMAHNGVGSGAHLACILFFNLINVEPTYVVYRGYGQTINDIMSGAVDGTCDSVASTSGHITGGSIKGFGVAGTSRHPLFPNVTTSIEAGLPGYQSDIWFGLTAPKGLPEPVLAKLQDAIAKTLADASVRKKIADIGGAVPEPDKQGGPAMQKHVESEVARWVDYMKKEPPPPAEK